MKLMSVLISFAPQISDFLLSRDFGASCRYNIFVWKEFHFEWAFGKWFGTALCFVMCIVLLMFVYVFVDRRPQTGLEFCTTSEGVSCRTTSLAFWRTTWRRSLSHNMWTRYPRLPKEQCAHCWTERMKPTGKSQSYTHTQRKITTGFHYHLSKA